MLISVIFGEVGYAISALLFPVPRLRMDSTLLLSTQALPLGEWREETRWCALGGQALSKLIRQEPEAARQLRTSAAKRCEFIEASHVLKIEHRKQTGGSQHEYIVACVDVQYEGKRYFTFERTGKASLADSSAGNWASGTSQSSKKFSNKLLGGDNEDGSQAMDSIQLIQKPPSWGQNDNTLLCTLDFTRSMQRPTFVDLCAVCCAVASLYSSYHLIKSQCYLFAISVYLVLRAEFPDAAETTKEIKKRGVWLLIPTASRSWTRVKYKEWTAVTSDLEGAPLPGDGVPIPSTDEARANEVLSKAHQDNAELQPFGAAGALTAKGQRKLLGLRKTYVQEAASLRAAMGNTARSDRGFDSASAVAPLPALRAGHPPGLNDEFAPSSFNRRRTADSEGYAQASTSLERNNGQDPRGGHRGHGFLASQGAV